MGCDRFVNRDSDDRTTPRSSAGSDHSGAFTGTLRFTDQCALCVRYQDAKRSIGRGIATDLGLGRLRVRPSRKTLRSRFGWALDGFWPLGGACTRRIGSNRGYLVSEAQGSFGVSILQATPCGITTVVPVNPELK